MVTLKTIAGAAVAEDPEYCYDKKVLFYDAVSNTYY
jgi:hypothetical protein